MLFKLHVLSCVCICICDAISALGAPCAFTDEVKDSQLAAIQEKSASLFKESKSLFPRYLHGSVNRFHSLALGTCVHYTAFAPTAQSRIDRAGFSAVPGFSGICPEAPFLRG